MNFLETFHMIVLCGMLCWAAYADLKEGKIPNALTVAGMLVGLALSLAGGGLRAGLMGMVAGGGPFLLLYLIGLSIRKPLMGAGDVKLMAAIGAFTGPVGALYSIYYGLLIAGLMALTMVISNTVRHRPLPKTIALGACLSFGTLFWVLYKGPLWGF